MCTCISYQSNSHYFGRNLDLEYSLNESVIITPRNYKTTQRSSNIFPQKYAMIGIGIVKKGYPLYYDATNEHGLSIAGLNFPGNAVYQNKKHSMINLTSFEFIPWILGHFRSVSEVMDVIAQVNLVNESFNSTYSLTPLHWMVSDNKQSIVIEPMQERLYVYDNPVGVLTNNPPFDYHLHNLTNYLNLSRYQPKDCLWEKLPKKPYSRGMGAIGLPGDLSSASRFVRAAYIKLNSIDDGTENNAVCQFFHILNAVEQQRGAVAIGDGYEITVYSSCCNTNKGVYYFKTYDNSQITAVDMFARDLNATELYVYPLITEQQINQIL